MLFSSIPFLYYFLPIVMIVYFALPKIALKNTWLFIASMFFYAWGEPKHAVLMLAAITFGYVYGLLIEKFHGKKLSKLFLVLSVLTYVGMFGYFKYTDFFIENINALTGFNIPCLKIALPIGISFFLFQILSYDIDVYRGEVAAQKNPIYLGCYVALFPQLIAGPIVRYQDIAEQLMHRKHSFENISLGARRFVIGLAKKVIIADQLNKLCNIFYLECDEKTVVFYWIYAIANMLCIYFDFSGYSCMAIGLGKMLGFDFLENFNYPYIAKSITDFWRRWHMSLSSWFRDYIYIPLGGNRCSKARNLFNILVVWLLTGFWHGAAWNFIIWGLFFAVLLIIEKTWLLKHLKKTKVVGHIYVLFLVMLSFIFFDATNVFTNDMSESMAAIGSLFGFGGIPFINDTTIHYLSSYAGLILIAIVGSTPLMKNLMLKAKTTAAGEKIVNVIEPILLVLGLGIVTACLVDGSFSPFLYFNF